MAPPATNTAPTRVLLIDGGQSGCRGRYVDGLAAASRGPEVCGPGVPRRGRDWSVLRSLVVGKVDLVVAGLTGFDGDAAAVARAVGTRVIVTNDAVIGYLGALGAQPGVVIMAGTGVIALASGEDGRWARADGWGSLLGDDGGGYWIGRRGLALALRARDGRGGSPTLLRRAESRFGARLVPAIYDAPDPVAAIATFAPDVADAASAGDELASAIWTDAARELAATVTAALANVDAGRPARSPNGDSPASCSYVGGLFAAGELLLAPLRAQLPGLRAPLGSPLDGAARLLARPSMFKSEIVEAGAP